MGLSEAERKRRQRAHHAGNHELCDPQRCATLIRASVGTADGPSVTVVPPGQTRGERLCAALCEAEALSPGERVLAEEIGRLADRLDRLDEHLKDRQWLQFEVANYSTATTTTVIIKLDRVLAEARQQQEVLKALISELRQSSSAKKPQPGPKAGGVGLADLSARIAARRNSSAG